MNPKNKLAEMPVRPLLYTMAVPLMLSLLIQSLYNIVDSIFVARLSETALTAASLVYAIQFLMIAIGVGTAVGLNALLSRKLGQKKPEEACRAATTGLFLMLGTSLVFTLVGLLFSNRIAAALTNDPELQQLCRKYLSVNLVFCWGIFLQTYGQRLLQAVGGHGAVYGLPHHRRGGQHYSRSHYDLRSAGLPSYGHPGRSHCHRHRAAHRRSGGAMVQSGQKPGHPCSTEGLSLFVAGCGRHLPGGAAYHRDAGHR